jgi:hypothetical protein
MKLEDGTWQYAILHARICQMPVLAECTDGSTGNDGLIPTDTTRCWTAENSSSRCSMRTLTESRLKTLCRLKSVIYLIQHKRFSRMSMDIRIQNERNFGL